LAPKHFQQKVLYFCPEADNLKNLPIQDSEVQEEPPPVHSNAFLVQETRNHKWIVKKNSQQLDFLLSWGAKTIDIYGQNKHLSKSIFFVLV